VGNAAVAISAAPGAVEQESAGRRGKFLGWCVGVFAVAVLLRAGVFLAASHVYGIPLPAYAAKGDGASYIAYAKAIFGDSSRLTEYDRRVFPGYPALIALGHSVGLSFPLAALLVDWLSAGIAAAAALSLFRDLRVGLAMVYLVPHYLTNSSLAMSEAPMLAFTLLGLLLVLRRRQDVVGGALLAFACLVRPMACFAVAGTVITLVTQRQWRRMLLAAAGGVLVIAAGIVFVDWFTADVFQSFRIYRDSPRAYGGHLFEWPFYSLINTPRSEHASAGFVTYIYSHVGIVLFACAMLVARLARRAHSAGDRTALDVLACTWLVGNTLFQLCIGSTWGFRHFARFAIPAQPALFWALCPMLPRRLWPWLVSAGGICYMAVVCVNLTP
jgi:Gpi18-like mannosyltransferase